MTERKQMVEADSDRVIKASSGEFSRTGTHVVSMSLEPGYTPPSALMNPNAHVTPVPSEAPPSQSVQAPAANAAPAQTE
jgi:hypothetical protein